ncbi:SRPBCC family protein [Streptomyces capparidis]
MPHPAAAPVPGITAVDGDAPVVVRLSTTVAAPLARVWALHTDVAAWPRWNPGIERAEPTGPFAPGAAFRWLTHGLDITSTVHQVLPGRRTVWGGEAHGIDGIHVWTFTSTGTGVTVRTEESWSGPPVEARPEELRQALERSLTDWLTHLRSAAENR